MYLPNVNSQQNKKIGVFNKRTDPFLVKSKQTMVERFQSNQSSECQFPQIASRAF